MSCVYLLAVVSADDLVSPIADTDRIFNVGSQLSGLVSGGFSKLGYIPVSTALEQCEGQGRWRVETALQR